MERLDLAVIGGGAAGFFSAIRAAELAPGKAIAIFERGRDVLTKVRISGGGRCNVTHHCFEPRELVQRYPRGFRELLGPFHRFQPKDTVAWFAARGVELKVEPDGRMFPVTDSSETIIQCLKSAATRAGVRILTNVDVSHVGHQNQSFVLTDRNGKSWSSKALMLATGGSRGDGAYGIAKKFGHTITPLAPSLFTFNIKSPLLEGLAGVAVEKAEVSVNGFKLQERGPVLVTHWGLSGPAILKLSAWGARKLAGSHYKFTINVNWSPAFSVGAMVNALNGMRKEHGKKAISNLPIPGLPSRLREALVLSVQIPAGTRLCDCTAPKINELAHAICACEFAVDGKSTNKDEFVTCGGVSLKEVDFRTMESKCQPGLYFAGEVLDIDGITGGFNFQAAWTGGYIAGEAIATTL